MSFSVGIVGLPNVGKSTLFKVLTKREVKISPRPFTTIEPNVGHVSLPDERLQKIANLIKPEKVTPTTIEFVDIAGLVKGAHKGEGLGNQFLSHIRNCHSILIVIRAFEDPEVENVLGEINPQKEFEILKVELLMKDLETVENAIKKLEKKKEKKELKKIELLKKIKEFLSQGKMVSEIKFEKEEEKEIREYQFLTQKPSFCVLNINGKTEFKEPSFPHLKINLKEEEEFLEFSEKEKEEMGFKSKIEELIKACYKILNLITFYTIAKGKEVKAWTAKEGTLAPEAGGIVHSDFERKFIRAEVISWEKLVEVGSWQKAKESGLIKIVGRDYKLEDGDVIEFKI